VTLAAEIERALPTVLRLAGAGQLALAAASLAVPRVLGWRTELRAVGPLTRQVFWTYAAYVGGSHVAFGAVSALRPEWLLAPSPLARATCAFVAAWWGARALVAALGRERDALPAGAGVRWAHRALCAAFVLLTAAYAGAAAAPRTGGP
jgi:hypothetical protein